MSRFWGVELSSDWGRGRVKRADGQRETKAT